MATQPLAGTNPAAGSLTAGRLGVAAALVAAQALFFAGWIVREQRGDGRLVRVALRPVDPRDWLRGQYLALAYEIESPEAYTGKDGVAVASGPKPARGALVHAALRRETDGVFRPVAFDGSREALTARLLTALPDFDADLTAPDARWVVIRGRVAGGGAFDFGINRYFVPEGSREPPMNARTVAVLHVNSVGVPRLRSLEVDGMAWTPTEASPPYRNADPDPVEF